MKKMMIALAILSLYSLHFTASLAAIQEFCVADYSSPRGPSGFACRDRRIVRARDFVFSGLGVPGNTSNLIKASVKTAFYNQFPALNGLGISFARVDFAPSGVIPFHYHHRASEIVVVIEGTLRVGIVSSDNTVYLNTLNKGDIIVFPQGMPHFLVNVGPTSALAFAAYNSENPGVEVIPFALFSNNLPTALVNAVSFIAPAEIRRLKALLGGIGFGSSE